MAFVVHRAERADVLADGLAALLAGPLPDPFATELVVVPARGVERWLSQRLSHRLGAVPGAEDGVCAGVDFRSPGSLVAELLGTREHDPWSPEAMVWPLLAVIDAAVAEPWCRALAAHLGAGRTGEEYELRQGRRYAVARGLARLFASYAVQRPGLLADWEAGIDGDGTGGDLDPDLRWQAELWRRLVGSAPAASPVARNRDLVAGLRADPGTVALPPRLSLFGHTRLARTDLDLLEALAVGRDVHLWLPHPSPVLWRALADLRDPIWRDQDASVDRVGHPLLASLGRDLRELQRVLPATARIEEPVAAAEPAEPDSVLALLQADLRADRIPQVPRAADPGDRSISVHSCHGPARQVEVLREVLLGLLADDPTLEPRDIVVMCPDIEAYAPLLSATFGLGEALAPAEGDEDPGHPGQRLRVRLADRALTQTNPLLAVASRLLDLAGGRAEASAVLDLLGLEPVRRRFGLTEDDLERVGHWVATAGVRWAFDAGHREPYSLAGIVQGTWRFGLDRILAGVAVSEDAGRWFGTTLPLDDVSSTDIDLAGRLAEYLDRLRRGSDALAGTRPVEHWVAALGEAIEALTLVPHAEEWQISQVRHELAEIGAAAGTGTRLRLSDVRALLRERFAGRPSRANFRTGMLTVCTMTPMRSVPHRVVALLGLDDGSFPRAGTVDGDDVLARRPVTGERDPRSEDRQLMLDAVTAATERLVITYAGADESTGRPRPPAVPLKELLDVLDRTVAGAAERALRHEPLQAFDPANFRAERPFSFDPAALAGARASLVAERVAPAPLRLLDLAPPAGDVDLAALTAFLVRPVQYFLRHRLEIALLEESEPDPDAIPVELDALQVWGVGDRMLTDLLAGRNLEEALALEWRRGFLPPGQLGWRIAQETAASAAPIAELAESFRAGAPLRAVDVDVEVDGGRRVVGTVASLHDTRVVRAGFSRLGPRQELEAWTAVLALEAAHPGRGWSAGAVGRGRKGAPPARITFGAPEQASARLAELVALYDAGMRGPLPLPLKTGNAWAARRVTGGGDQDCRYRAEREWNPFNARFPGENADPAHRFVWGEAAPLSALLDTPRPGEEHPGETTRLGALAMRLWEPVLKAGVRR